MAVTIFFLTLAFLGLSVLVGFAVRDLWQNFRRDLAHRAETAVKHEVAAKVGDAKDSVAEKVGDAKDAVAHRASDAVSSVKRKLKHLF